VLLLTILVFLVIRESTYRRPNTRVDYGGAVLLGGALAGIVAALSQGQVWGWSSPLTLGFLGAGLLLLIPFVFWEIRWKALGREPIVDQGLLRERNVLVTNVVLTVAGLGMYMALFALIYRFEFPAISGGFSLDILQAGLAIVPLAVSMILVAIAASVVVSKVGVKPLAFGGAVITSLGFVTLAWATTLDQSLAAEVLTGAGIALLNASIINMLVLTVDPKDMGQATAMNNVFRNLGGSVGAPIVGSLLAAYVTNVMIAGSYAPKLLAFQYAFWIAAAITLIGGTAVLFGEEVLGPRRHAKFAHHAQPAPVTSGSRPAPAEPTPRPSVSPSRADAPAEPGTLA
jgi:hypothetical protein